MPLRVGRVARVIIIAINSNLMTMEGGEVLAMVLELVWVGAGFCSSQPYPWVYIYIYIHTCNFRIKTLNIQ